MKNLHLIPTDKPSRLCINGKNQMHIYITSDEDIKEDDWYASFILDEDTKWKTTKLDCVVKADLNKTNEYLVEPFSKYCKKIILTTDQDLIKDGVQAIDDGFLEWFVENPSCESVEVKPLLSNNGRVFYGYKIIIPQEEPKQETLEEAAEFNFEKQVSNPYSTGTAAYTAYEKGFELGAKWQQEKMGLMEIELNHIKTLLASCEKALENRDKKAERMYSEEEVINLLETQRGNSYVAVLTATKNDELASIALNAPEPGEIKQFKKK
jgi:hypothetical protein